MQCLLQDYLKNLEEKTPTAALDNHLGEPVGICSWESYI